jgi:putative endonuclease
MWFVYVLLCEGNSLYTGSTDDLEKRFKAHQAGKGGRYTRSHKPLKVVYSEKLPTKSAALKREYQIKSWDRLKKIRDLKLKTLL